jgi:hypothetical protein
MEDDTDSTINELFVQETVDPRIESVMPILARLNKNKATTTVKEVEELAEWADSITEMDDGIPDNLSPAERKEQKERDKKEYDKNLKNTPDAIKKKLNLPDSIEEDLSEGWFSDFFKGLSPKETGNQNFQQTQTDLEQQFEKHRKEWRNRMINPYKRLSNLIDQSDWQKVASTAKVIDNLANYGISRGYISFSSVEEKNSFLNKLHNLMKKITVTFGNIDRKDFAGGGTGAAIGLALGGLPGAAIGGALGSMRKSSKLTTQELAIANARAHREDSKKYFIKKLENFQPEFIETMDLVKNKPIKLRPARGGRPVAGNVIDEDLDADQKRVGQLGPTEKVGKEGAVGKLVGANEAVAHDSPEESVIMDIVNGNIDAYQVMNHPKTKPQQNVADILQQMYDDVTTDHPLHSDDDFEKILNIVVDRLADEYDPYPMSESINENAQDSVANALYTRVTRVRTDLLNKYGIGAINDAIDEISSRFAGEELDEIGSSDVSGWIRQLEQILASSSSMSEGQDDLDMIKRLVK